MSWQSTCEQRRTVARITWANNEKYHYRSNWQHSNKAIFLNTFFVRYLQPKISPWKKRSVSKKCKSYGKETLPEDMDHRKSRNLTKRIILGRDDAWTTHPGGRWTELTQQAASFHGASHNPSRRRPTSARAHIEVLNTIRLYYPSESWNAPKYFKKKIFPLHRKHTVSPFKKKTRQLNDWDDNRYLVQK